MLYFLKAKTHCLCKSHHYFPSIILSLEGHVTNNESMFLLYTSKKTKSDKTDINYLKEIILRWKVLDNNGKGIIVLNRGSATIRDHQVALTTDTLDFYPQLVKNDHLTQKGQKGRAGQNSLWRKFLIPKVGELRQRITAFAPSLHSEFKTTLKYVK